MVTRSDGISWAVKEMRGMGWRGGKQGREGASRKSAGERDGGDAKRRGEGEGRGGRGGGEGANKMGIETSVGKVGQIEARGEAGKRKTEQQATN